MNMQSIISKPEFYDFKQLTSHLLNFPQPFSLSLFFPPLAIWVSMEEKLKDKFLGFFFYFPKAEKSTLLMNWLYCATLELYNISISFFFQSLFVSWEFIYYYRTYNF